MAGVNPLPNNPLFSSKTRQAGANGSAATEGSFQELFSGLAREATKSDKPSAPGVQQAARMRREVPPPQGSQPVKPEPVNGTEASQASATPVAGQAKADSSADEAERDTASADSAAPVSGLDPQLLALAAQLQAAPSALPAVTDGERGHDMQDRDKSHRTDRLGMPAILREAGDDQPSDDALTGNSGAAFLEAIGDAKALAARPPALAGDETLRAAQADVADATAIAEVPPAIPAPLQRVAELTQAARPDEARLAPRVGSTGWDRALGQKVVWMAGSGEQSASLTLNPPDLGPLQVVLTLSESQASADFRSAQPEVRQALQDAMPRLREMLGEAGISLGQANVSSGSAGEQAFSREPGGNGGRRGQGSGEIDDGAPAAGRLLSGEGLVNTYA